ncbi:type IX secretion/gliding motility protein PorT/SprT [Hymenobacter crusticola]|uniref:Outer membrane protein beta-barrel domain-containing protein n=1 Tax=Hymenobacter crusticola TaxID=1770526 RepID=A0A243WFJ6_9BACT|nr:porin family protein [Hymenobacter crusticola]OUJ74490.1 hypothetical protein BXP70_06815 [Hymenobacter crusticola]
MATSYVRHQLYLHRSKITRFAFAALAAAVVALPSHAQNKSRTKSSRTKSGHVKSITTDNLPGYDDKWFHPGFYLAPNFSRFQIQQSASYIQAINSGQGISANALVSPGFSVGFVGDVRLADYLTLRFTPGVSFLSRRIEFTNQGYSGQDTIVTQEIGSTQIDLPVLFKLHSQRRRNTRVYVVGGIRPSFNVGNRRKNPELFKLRADDTDLTLEYGVGLDLFYPLFKFAPELRFSSGLKNLLLPGTDVYSNSLQRLTSNTVTLYLTFE